MRRPRVVLAALVVFTAIASVVPAAAAPPSPVRLADASLARAVARLERGRPPGPDVEVDHGRLGVEVLHHGDHTAVRAMIEAAGARIRGEVPGVLFEAAVPFAALEALEASDPIDLVRVPLVVNVPLPDHGEPTAAESAGYEAEEVARTRADTWHRAGHQGQGVTVGILGQFRESEWDFAAADGELPPQPPSFCRRNGSSCQVWASGNGHLFAEVVHDMAPEADLRLGWYTTTADFQAVMEDFAANGVDVVVRAQSGPFDGPGDGSGPIDAVIDSAVASGMVFVQAAGDTAGSTQAPGSHYRWTYADQDGDGWVEFAPGDETLVVSDCRAFNGLRWDDFGEGATTTDYDLYASFSDNPGGLLDGEADQSLGAPPTEQAECHNRFAITVSVKRVSDETGAVGDNLELMAPSGDFEHWTNPSSAAGPAADTANPGALTVGAIDPWVGTTAGPTSAQGPTTDGRIKPDLTAGSCLTSATIRFNFDPFCFAGTSASASVTAGAAALYRETQPSATPAQVAGFLRSTAVDRGPTGPDNTYGAGELRLPSMGPRPVRRPDALIRGSGANVGDNIYNLDGQGQNATLAGAALARVQFTATFQNDGTAEERLLIEGTPTSGRYVTQYWAGTRNITDAVVAGTYRTALLPPGGAETLQVRVTIPGRARSALDRYRGALQVVSITNGQTRDLVHYTVNRR